MSQLLIRDIQKLVQVHDGYQPAHGSEMGVLPMLENSYLLVEGGRIVALGPMSECPERADRVVSAKGRMVFPAWCDSHTHLVFAESREGEFVDRIRGLSYEEIARRGGGILNSARRLQETPEEVLFERALDRLHEVQRLGTGALEIKSGYGLTPESELKMLRVIRKLKTHSSMTVKATFLGAHALPPAFKSDRQGYIRLLIEEMLPKVAGEGLADYIDVFCEKGFFTVSEMEQILKAGARYGLKPKVHTNQFNSMGGVQAAVRQQALSVDHLEVVSEADIDTLQNSRTMATLLPSAPFFLNDPYPPARKMIEAGLAIALATDYNPGSTPSGRMAFVLSLACLKMQMTPEEAINGATRNGACAMEVQRELGTLQPGKTANFFITKPIPSVAYLPYAFGSDLIDRVYLQGKLVDDRTG